jgi:hypothetical protein
MNSDGPRLELKNSLLVVALFAIVAVLVAVAFLALEVFFGRHFSSQRTTGAVVIAACSGLCLGSAVVGITAEQRHQKELVRLLEALIVFSLGVIVGVMIILD